MSRPASPETRKFAEKLMAREAAGAASTGSGPSTVWLASEKLRPQLTELMGTVGYNALQSRALALATGQFPWLRAVHVKTDGGFGGLEAIDAQIDRQEFAEGCIVLLAHLLGLLRTFIGDKLTLRLVIEVWPDLPLDDLDFGTGET